MKSRCGAVLNFSQQKRGETEALYFDAQLKWKRDKSIILLSISAATFISSHFSRYFVQRSIQLSLSDTVLWNLFIVCWVNSIILCHLFALTNSIPSLVRWLLVQFILCQLTVLLKSNRKLIQAQSLANCVCVRVNFVKSSEPRYCLVSKAQPSRWSSSCTHCAYTWISINCLGHDWALTLLVPICYLMSLSLSQL